MKKLILILFVFVGSFAFAETCYVDSGVDCYGARRMVRVCYDPQCNDSSIDCVTQEFLDTHTTCCIE